MSVSPFVGGRRNVIHEGSSPRDILGNLSVLCLQLNGQQYIIQIPRSVQGSNDAAGKAYTKHQSKGLSFDDTVIKSRFVENGAFNMTSLSSNRSSSLTAIYFQISKFSTQSRHVGEREDALQPSSSNKSDKSKKGKSTKQNTGRTEQPVAPLLSPDEENNAGIFVRDRQKKSSPTHIYCFKNFQRKKVIFFQA